MKATVSTNSNVSDKQRNAWFGYFGTDTIEADVYEHWGGDLADGQTDWKVMVNDLPEVTIDRIAQALVNNSIGTFDNMRDQVIKNGVLMKTAYVIVTPLEAVQS